LHPPLKCLVEPGHWRLWLNACPQVPWPPGPAETAKAGDLQREGFGLNIRDRMANGRDLAFLYISQEQNSKVQLCGRLPFGARDR
jgi:hypothetical protein